MYINDIHYLLKYTDKTMWKFPQSSYTQKSIRKTLVLSHNCVSGIHHTSYLIRYGNAKIATNQL